MDRHTQHTIYEEFINRYEKLIISRIYKFKSNEDVDDLFQDVCLHIYVRIPIVFHRNPDAFSSSAWVVQVVDRYLISNYRKENAQKNVQNKTISNLTEYQWNLISGSHNASDREIHLTEFDYEKVLNSLFAHISRQDAIMLKMKYYYGKSSDYISNKLNISHVNMRIKRVKEQIQNKVPESIYLEIKERFFKEN